MRGTRRTRFTLNTALPLETSTCGALSCSLAAMSRLQLVPVTALLRHRWRVLALSATAAIVILSFPCARLLTVNTTSSLPPGFYLRITDPVNVGAIVEFRVPKQVRGHLSGRSDYLIKPVVAGPGDTIDTTSGEVILNGIPVANSRMLERDSYGSDMVQWRERRTLVDGEFFVLSTRIPNSLDSRYFGPIRLEQIECVRRCVWSWE